MSAIIKNITNIVTIPKSSARNSKDMVRSTKVPSPVVPLKKETNYRFVNSARCSLMSRAQVSRIYLIPIVFGINRPEFGWLRSVR